MWQSAANEDIYKVDDSDSGAGVEGIGLSGIEWLTFMVHFYNRPFPTTLFFCEIKLHYINFEFGKEFFLPFFSCPLNMYH